MAGGLTHTEEFLVLFNRLKDAARNKPENAETLYKNSRAFRALNAFLLRSDLERRAFHGHKLMVPRAAGFEAAWREYDTKWRFREIWGSLEDLLIVIDFGTAEQKAESDREITSEPPVATALEAIIPSNGEAYSPDPEHEETFNPIVHDGGAALELGIEQLGIHADADWDAYAKSSCSLALGAYDYLTETIGLNTREVFRRWRRVPVVFMPAHVGNKYGASDKGSLLSLLNDAVKAYVFGAPAAAIAMCRAALEMVLKKHYGHGQWDDEKLENLIVLASKRYDRIVQGGKIDPFRKIANRILHGYDNIDCLSEEDERAIIEFFKTLKFLIQRAPKV